MQREAHVQREAWKCWREGERLEVGPVASANPPAGARKGAGDWGFESEAPDRPSRSAVPDRPSRFAARSPSVAPAPRTVARRALSNSLPEAEHRG